MPEDSRPVTEFQLRRILTDLGPPRVAQNFGWTRVGNEILFEVGYFDLVAVNAAINRAKEAKETPPTLEWFITDRFVMGVEAATRLVEIMESLKKELAQLKKGS